MKRLAYIVCASLFVGACGEDSETQNDADGEEFVLVVEDDECVEDEFGINPDSPILRTSDLNVNLRGVERYEIKCECVVCPKTCVVNGDRVEWWPKSLSDSFQETWEELHKKILNYEFTGERPRREGEKVGYPFRVHVDGPYAVWSNNGTTDKVSGRLKLNLKLTMRNGQEYTFNFWKDKWKSMTELEQSYRAMKKCRELLEQKIANAQR